MTNGDKIRAMSDEEIAKQIARYLDCDRCPFLKGPCANYENCYEVFLHWLKQPAEGE